MLFLYILISVSIVFLISISPKKELLEILQTNEKIYFLLSGDEYVVLPVENGNNKELILNVMNRYKNELSSIVDRVILVNSRCYDFERELNSLIKG